MQTRYLLDTTIYITAKNNYYAFDLVPGFWDFLVEFGRRQIVLSIDRVQDELKSFKPPDQLANWAWTTCKHAFLDSSEAEVLDAYRNLMNWAHGKRNPEFLRAALTEFARRENADPWLVAYAAVKGFTVVTLEPFRPQCFNEVKIPNACHGFSVKYCTTFEMLRELKVQFPGMTHASK